MKRWRECRPADRREVVAQALAQAGSVTGAAALLGMNRQYLHEVMAKMGLRDSVGGVGTGVEGDINAGVGGVGQPEAMALRHGAPVPTFRRMGLAVTAEPTERLVVEIPASIKERLEIAAARKKRSLGLDRPAMGPLVTEALSRYLDQEEDPEGGGA